MISLREHINESLIDDILIDEGLKDKVKSWIKRGIITTVLASSMLGAAAQNAKMDSVNINEPTQVEYVQQNKQNKDLQSLLNTLGHLVIKCKQNDDGTFTLCANKSEDKTIAQKSYNALKSIIENEIEINGYNLSIQKTPKIGKIGGQFSYGIVISVN